MLKYFDGVEVKVGDRVRFNWDALSAHGIVHKICRDDALIELFSEQHRGWNYDNRKVWAVPPHALERIGEVKYPTPAFTQLKGRPDDPYSVGPEGETAGYIARGGGLKYL